MGLPTKIVVGCFLVLIGVTGAIIHLSLSSSSVSVNQYHALWMAIYFAEIAAEWIFLEHYGRPSKDASIMAKLGCMWLVFVYFLGSIINAICLALAGLVAACIWSAASLPITAYTIAAFYKGWVKDEKRASASCCNRWICMITTVRIFWIFGMSLLIYGSIAAAIAASYPAPGKFSDVSLANGKSVNVHYYCEGAFSDTVPTIWITSSPAHGVVDFYGIQGAIAGKGRRMCSYDNPGFGWSGPLMPGFVDEASTTFLNSFLTVIQEPMPIVVAAWAGGADQAVEFATRHPAKVTAVVFIQVYANVEGPFNTPEKIQAERNVWQGRASVASLFNVIGTPFGLISMIFSVASVDAAYEPPTKRAEFRVQTWKSNLWVQQYWFLRKLIDDVGTPTATDTKTLGPQIRLVHIRCLLSSAQICKATAKRRHAVTEPDCKKRQDDNEKNIMLQGVTLNRLQPVGIRFFVNSTDDDCGLDMPLIMPQFVAKSLLASL